MGDANMAYDAKVKELRKKIKQLESQIERHETQQKRRPTDMNFVQDLESAIGQLELLMRTLG